MSHRIRVGIVRGGPSAEYDISLASGASVLTALRNFYADTYEAHDILIDKQGKWHLDGAPVDPHDIAHRIDIAFNALHGAYGEDGKIQHLFEAHGIPFTGSGSLASAVGMNKVLSKKAFESHDIKSPYWKEISSENIWKDAAGVVGNLFQTFHLPAVVKPTSSGSSVGVTIVRNYTDLPGALALAAQHGDSVLIEEYIPGVEATGGVIEGFRGHDIYVLPIVEIRPHAANGFFDHAAKYLGQSEEIVPATFTEKIKKSLEELSVKVHRALGLRHYSRTDFIIHPKRGIYVLEVNTLPGLTPESLIPKALRAVGSDTHELVDHLIRMTLGE